MHRIYTYYCLLILAILFLGFFPLQFLLLQFRSMYHLAHEVNHIALRIGFFLMGFRIRIEGKEHLNRNENYVFVANHFSMFDIPIMFFVVKGYGVFVGKDSLEKIPLFGYMYKRLYVTVNRRDAESRQKVFEEGLQSLRNGHSLVIFPEGTISMKAPELLHFKDGAFKIAQEAGRKIVPVSILNNWKILPDETPITIKNLTFAAKINPPVDPPPVDDNTSLAQVKQQVFDIIDTDLKRAWSTS